MKSIKHNYKSFYLNKFIWFAPLNGEPVQSESEPEDSEQVESFEESMETVEPEEAIGAKTEQTKKEGRQVLDKAKTMSADEQLEIMLGENFMRYNFENLDSLAVSKDGVLVNSYNRLIELANDPNITLDEEQQGNVEWAKTEYQRVLKEYGPKLEKASQEGDQEEISKLVQAWANELNVINNKLTYVIARIETPETKEKNVAKMQEYIENNNTEKVLANVRNVLGSREYLTNADTEAVMGMQYLLNNSLLAGDEIAVDGMIGPNTENAIKTFQQSIRQRGVELAVDGLYGAKTHKALEDDYFGRLSYPEQAPENNSGEQVSRMESEQIETDKVALKDGNWFDRLRLGKDTAAIRATLNAPENSENKQEIANDIALSLYQEAAEEKQETEGTFVNFSEKYSVNNPMAVNPAEMVYSVFHKIDLDDEISRNAVEYAKSNYTEQAEETQEQIDQSATEIPNV